MTPLRQLARALAPEPRLHRRGRDLAGARHRREHRAVLRQRRTPAPPASLPGARAPRHPLESIARPRHRRRLVLHRAVLRHPPGTERVQRRRDRNRRLRDAHRPRRTGAAGCASGVVESPADAWRSTGARTLLPAGGRHPRTDRLRGARAWRLGAPVRRRSGGGRPNARAERRALRDRGCASRRLLAATLGAPDARRGRGRRRVPAAAARACGSRCPHRRGLQHPRAAPSRRAAAGRAGRARRAHRASAAGSSRNLSSQRRPHVQRGATPGSGRWSACASP